jgi:hypothetical protein
VGGGCYRASGRGVQGGGAAGRRGGEDGCVEGWWGKVGVSCRVGEIGSEDGCRGGWEVRVGLLQGNMGGEGVGEVVCRDGGSMMGLAVGQGMHEDRRGWS